MKLRIRLLTLLVMIGFLVIMGRLFYWQVVRGQNLSAEARNQYQSRKTITAPRGTIKASDGSLLAARGEKWLVFADLPNVSGDKRSIADKLAPLFLDADLKNNPDEGNENEGYGRTELLAEVERIDELLSRDGVWVPIKHGLDTESKDKIAELEIEGIGFEPQESRYYPEASVAAHLLGFVGKNESGEDQGYFGLEGYYDLSLSGKPGHLHRESDAAGVPILLEKSNEILASPGVDLVTNIDKAVQLSVESKLIKGIERYGAVTGSVIVMEPKTGAVVAMSNYPSYDPAHYVDFGNEFFINPMISSSFEPGSIFKVIVMAAGLDAEVVETDTKCEICGGPLKVDKYTIETWNQEYTADSTMVDVIVHSDNVGMAFVGDKLGAELMYDYIEKFGFGSLTDVDLQGEMTPGIRKKGTWNIVDVATTSFGQGIAVTPIQMIRAVSAIANGGKLPTPKVVKKLESLDWSQDVDIGTQKRVISKETARDMTQMMVEAASAGEAKWTHVGGFRVAGKTGTAQIPIAGHYDEEKTIASFVGFAPYNDPKFIMLVTLREPESSPWASETAAPLWYSIAKDLFLYYGIQPEK